MQLYNQKINTRTGQFNLVPSGTIITFKTGVSTAGELPSEGNELNDARIVNNTGHLYVWNGTIWIDQGDIIDLKWTTIEGGPTSAPVEIDSAVSLKHNNSLDHIQNTDTVLDEGGSDEVSAAVLKNALEQISTLQDNLVVTDWRLQISSGISVLKFVDSVVDEFQDESGVDLINSINQTYNAENKYYSGESVPAEDSYTKLLLHLNSLPFIDERGHEITNADVTLDTVNTKFSNTAYFGVNRNRLVLDTSTDWDFLLGDFTIDFWVNATALGDYMYLFSEYIIDSSYHHFSLMFNNNLTELQLVLPDDSITAFSHGITAGTWNHIAMVRNGDELKVYVNGIVKHTHDITGQTIRNEGMGNVTLGCFNDGINNMLLGNMDEVRISKGIARWIENFDVPTQPYSIVPSDIVNMTLISKATEANDEPTSARLVVLLDPIDEIIINEDIKFYISEDDGINYDQVTLTDEGYFDTEKSVFAGSVTLTSQSDKTMRWKIQTFNTKDIQVHGVGLLWK